LLVESVKDYAIFMLNPAGQVASWNAGAQLIKGYAPPEIIGQHFSVFYTPEDRAGKRPEKLLGAAAMDGRVEDEGWRVRKDGGRFWADVVITALRDGAGELVGFAKVTRDLTARRKAEERLREAERRAEEALRQSEERMRQMIASVHDHAFFMLDRDGRVVSWNPGAERIKGYAAAEIIGEHFSRFFTPDDIAAHKPELELELAARDGRFEDEAWRVRKDGARFWADVVLSAVRDASGQLIGFTKVTRDLTERRRMEDERVQTAKAHEAVRLRDEFLSIASHELKTPLTALKLQLEGLMEHTPPVEERLARKLEKAKRATDRLGQLVESLLDVSRIATGRMTLAHESFDLLEAAREVIDRMRAAASSAGCEVSLRGQGPVIGSWDRLRVEQVVVNLLANAFKYAAGSAVIVLVSDDGHFAQLEVRDAGPGLPRGDASRLFRRFERAASASYAGLGLGLYVSSEIAEAHGGTITARALEPSGASFIVRLPRQPGALAGGRAQP
jgi:PAS domain S-box-containing protein